MPENGDTYDVVILGGGNAGYSAAFRSSQLGMSVAMAWDGASAVQYRHRTDSTRMSLEDF